METKRFRFERIRVPIDSGDRHSNCKSILFGITHSDILHFELQRHLYACLVLTHRSRIRQAIADWTNGFDDRVNLFVAAGITQNSCNQAADREFLKLDGILCNGSVQLYIDRSFTLAFILLGLLFNNLHSAGILADNSFSIWRGRGNLTTVVIVIVAGYKPAASPGKKRRQHPVLQNHSFHYAKN